VKNLNRAIAIGVVIILAAWGVIGYVAHHFISKYW
jgi:hypothetical protein